MDLEKENKDLRLEVESIRQEMNKQFSHVMSLIQQNPRLAQVKPEALVEKSREI
jgi:hypothetical protein